MSPTTPTPPAAQPGHRPIQYLHADTRPAQPGRPALVVLAGIPGAGKSTTLRKLDRARLLDGAHVLDTDAARGWLQEHLRRAPYPLLRPLVHTAHWARVIVLIFTAPRPLVVHDTATRALSRAVLLRLARFARRPARLVWIETEPLLARQGQLARGRVLRQAAFAGHVRRISRCHPAAAAGPAWDQVQRTDRQGAAAAVLAAAGGLLLSPPANTAAVAANSDGLAGPGWISRHQ